MNEKLINLCYACATKVKQEGKHIIRDWGNHESTCDQCGKWGTVATYRIEVDE